MHLFSYKSGVLHCEDVDLTSIADAHGTPTYVYSAGTIRERFSSLDTALSKSGLSDRLVAYAVKANSNLSVLRLLAGLGSGFDVVSGGELHRVISAGGDPGQCTFAGVGKTAEEIGFAIDNGIYCFNVESVEELRQIAAIAVRKGTTANVAVRINPDVDAETTHRYIATGKAENKFGIDQDDVAEVCDLVKRAEGVALKGLQMHIGSQLTSTSPFVAAVQGAYPLVERLKKDHPGLEFFSVGGGLGIDYESALESGEKEASGLAVESYVSALAPLLRPLGLKIVFEPGRFLTGNAGVLLTRCLYEKKGEKKTFKIVDAGMNDLVRPALYGSHHQIVPVVKESGSPTIRADVVGPICESGDFLCEDRQVADFKGGDLVAVMSAGAYGFTMASNYNSRPMPAEVLVDGGEARVVRRRQNWEDLVALEHTE